MSSQGGASSSYEKKPSLFIAFLGSLEGLTGMPHLLGGCGPTPNQVSWKGISGRSVLFGAHYFVFKKWRCFRGDSHQNLSFILLLTSGKFGSTEHAKQSAKLCSSCPFRQVGILHCASIPTTPYCVLNPQCLCLVPVDIWVCDSGFDKAV